MKVSQNAPPTVASYHDKRNGEIAKTLNRGMKGEATEFFSETNRYRVMFDDFNEDDDPVWVSRDHLEAE